MEKAWLPKGQERQTWFLIESNWYNSETKCRCKHSKTKPENYWNASNLSKPLNLGEEINKTNKKNLNVTEKKELKENKEKWEKEYTWNEV